MMGVMQRRECGVDKNAKVAKMNNVRRGEAGRRGRQFVRVKWKKRKCKAAEKV